MILLIYGYLGFVNIQLFDFYKAGAAGNFNKDLKNHPELLWTAK